MGNSGGNEAYLLGKQGADIEGIDGSEEMIRQAKERYPQLVDRFRIGNVTEFPYPDETFDIIISKYVINELIDPDAFSREAARCLKPGGTLIFFVHHPQSQMEFSRTYDYFRRGPVESKLGEKLSIIEPQHQVQDYLSGDFTQNFILEHFKEGQDRIRLHKNKNIGEMFAVKATKRL